MKPVLSVVFCKKAKDFTLYGTHENEKPLFVNNGAAQTEREGEENSKLFHNIQESRAVSVEPEQATGQGLQTTASKTIAPAKLTSERSKIEFIAKCISQGYTVDMLLQNFIASVMTCYKADFDPTIEQVLLLPILINTLCMTYSQYKLVIDGFIKARSGNSNDNISDHILIKNQLQALAGLLSAIETGIRWYFSMIAVFSQPNDALKHTLAAIAGISKGGSFFLTSGHAACDIRLGKTLIGKIIYGLLTSPVMPDYITFIITAAPSVVGATYFSAIFNIKSKLNEDNIALTSLIYSIAIFSGITAFVIQKSFGSETVLKNIRKNAESIEEWNKFWYGDADDANICQKASYAIKRFIDIITALPFAAVDITDRVLNVCCYFILAILPIQIIALFQYISQPALTYWVYYQVFHNTQGIIKTYTGKDTVPMTQQNQYLATLISIPLGLASAFAILNAMGGAILEKTDAIYNNSMPITVTTPETPLIQPDQSGSLYCAGLYNRLTKMATFAKDSVKAVWQSSVAQFNGDNGLKKHIG